MIEQDKILLESELATMISNYGQVSILCLGNELRGNDKIGMYIGRILKERIRPEFREKIILGYNSPVNFLSKIAELNPDLLLVIDAITGDFEQGKIILCGPQVTELQTFTTHYQSITQIRNYLEDTLHKEIEIKILGISIDTVKLMEDMEPEIKKLGDFIAMRLSDVMNKQVN